MEIYIFSDNKLVKNCFKSIERSRDFSISFYLCSDLKKYIKKSDQNIFFYIDVAGFQDQALAALLRGLARREDIQYGILDARGVIEDVAALFYDGAADYIGKTLFKNGILPKRLKTTVSFCITESEEEAPRDKVPACHDLRIVESGWQSVESGKEYTFIMMFIELDNFIQMDGNIDSQRVKKSLETFRNYVERNINDCGGRFWIWNDFSGLVLFPFDGTHLSCVTPCMRMMIFRKLFSIEEFEFNMLVSFRIVLHVGNTVYREEGDTGTIVSDSINSIFHLGQKFAKPGNFYITDEAFSFMQKELQDSFAPDGSFEGRDILRMKLPV